MYKVTVIESNKKSKKKNTWEFMLGDMDTPEYDRMMAEISDTLYNMDLEYNDVDGDGDMAVDDMLISISEEEDFERQMHGGRCDYQIKGKTI